MKRSSHDLLKCRSGILRATGLVMLPISSMMLVQVFEEENSAQLHTILPEFGFAMDAFKLWYASTLHCFIQFHVPIHSRTLQKQRSSNGNGCCLKKLQEKVREKFDEKFLDLKNESFFC